MSKRTLNYYVRKEKGGKYYVVYRNSPFPIRGSYGDNKKAIKFAADLEKLTTKEYMRLRKDVNNETD